VLIGLSAIVPVGIFGLFAVYQGGFFLPNPLLFKAGGASASAFNVLLKPIGDEELAFFRNTPALLLFAALALAAAATGILRVRTLWFAGAMLPLTLVMMIALHAHFVFSSTFWAYRYDAYLAGFGIFALAAAHAVLLGKLQRLGVAQWLTVGVLAGLALFAVSPRESLAAATEVEGVRDTNLEHVETARFIRDYYPHEVVAVNDLGAVTFFTDAHILDLVGLGNLEPLQIMRTAGDYTAQDVAAWLAPYQPRIAIIQPTWSWIAPRVPRSWIKVAEIAIPPHGERVGFFAIDPTAAALLRANVHYHFGELRAASGYRVRSY
jgi:hypothetical protein